MATKAAHKRVSLNENTSIDVSGLTVISSFLAHKRISKHSEEPSPLYRGTSLRGQHIRVSPLFRP